MEELLCLWVRPLGISALCGFWCIFLEECSISLFHILEEILLFAFLSHWVPTVRIVFSRYQYWTSYYLITFHYFSCIPINQFFFLNGFHVLQQHIYKVILPFSFYLGCYLNKICLTFCALSSWVKFPVFLKLYLWIFPSSLPINF